MGYSPWGHKEWDVYTPPFIFGPRSCMRIPGRVPVSSTTGPLSLTERH